MIGVRMVSLDGEPIHVFNSALYIFESAEGNTLELDMIISEIALQKYKDRDSLITEIELMDGTVINSFMFVKTLPGRLPRLNLYCGLDENEGYESIPILNESDMDFPDIEEGITLADIRKVEMPYEKIALKLNLPIDQVEWLKKHKNKDINVLMEELLYQYLNK